MLQSKAGPFLASGEVQTIDRARMRTDIQANPTTSETWKANRGLSSKEIYFRY